MLRPEQFFAFYTGPIIEEIKQWLAQDDIDWIGWGKITSPHGIQNYQLLEVIAVTKTGDLKQQKFLWDTEIVTHPEQENLESTGGNDA